MNNGRFRYIITLPGENVGVPGYENVLKVGETTASSEAGAVTQYLHRNLPHEAAVSVAAQLKRDFGGLETFAVLAPGVGNGRSFTKEERDFLTQMALAQELARKEGSERPEEYLGMAGNLLGTIKENKRRSA